MAEELAIKRLRYFDHQFLRVDDFQEEQDYHLRMRRRLNRVLHTWGVAEGLGVTAAAGDSAVKVAPGTAIDEQGREIVLLTERVEPLGTYAVKTVFVTLRYLEEPTDETDETGTGFEARRWTERAEIRVVDAAPARQGETLLLARVNLAANGTVASVDEGDVAARRRYAGVVGGDLEVRSLALASEGRPTTEFPLLRWGAANRADLTGSLRVTQNAAVAGKLAVGVAAADASVHLKGGGGDLTGGEGDLKVGDANQRLKIGVALGGTGGGDARIRAHGGTNRLILGSGTSDVLTVVNGRVGIGTLDPIVSLQVPESGIQIGTGATVANNFHFVSDEVPAGSPRALRLYGGNYGSGSHLLSVTPAGRVGIGMTNPGAPLHVRGRVISHAASGYPGGFSLIPVDTSAWFHIDHPGGNRMRFSHGGEPGGTELMTITGSGAVGIGTSGPAARFQVSGGAIMPAAGNSKEAGIMFPENPGDGSGDAAWIRYYARSGEATTLEIGTSNDPDDHISLMPSGGVGVGTTTPQDKLQVHGGLRILTDGNPIRFTSRWSGHADASKAEIANDTVGDKKLMIVGNSSGGGNIRRVGIWDELQVHGRLYIDSHLNVGGLIGAGGQSPLPRNPNWGGGVHTFDLEAEGTIWCRNDVLGRKFVPTGADLAENYSSPQALEPADVVSLDPDGEGVVRSTRAHDAMVLGIVSSYPGVVLNGDVEIPEGTFPIGLCGRVPCKVTDENGPIRRGDLLTSSSTPGHAMRAEPAGAEGGGQLRPGAVIGKALGSLESGSGVIEVFVQVR